MDDIKIDLAKISTRQEAILEKLTEQSETLKDQAQTLAKQNVSLELHIQRTHQNEESIQHLRLQTASMLEVAEVIKQRIEPLESESIKRVAVREFGLSCLKWAAGIGTLISGIYAVLQYLK
jgi:chromosome segregation ATPase